MHYLREIAVDDGLVDELWERVKHCGSFYSIGDGYSKEHFRSVLFRSEKVFRGEGMVVRLEAYHDYLEIHPIVLGPSAFRHTNEMLNELIEVSAKSFYRRPICCIIPNRMRGARLLARSAGMILRGCVERNLSGVMIPCGVWR